MLSGISPELFFCWGGGGEFTSVFRFFGVGGGFTGNPTQKKIKQRKPRGALQLWASWRCFGLDEGTDGQVLDVGRLEGPREPSDRQPNWVLHGRGSNQLVPGLFSFSLLCFWLSDLSILVGEPSQPQKGLKVGT